MQNTVTYSEAIKELLPVIEKEIPIGVRAQQQLSVKRVVEETMRTQENFAPQLSLTEILKQEVPYYTQHGHNAFDCGYMGLTKSKK